MTTPDACQVADPWHLWHNLAEHVEKIIARRYRCLAVSADQPPNRPPHLALVETERALVVRTRRRHEAVQGIAGDLSSVANGHTESPRPARRPARL
jgi:hypothetical protein